jgi:group I intron endonuclease
MASGPYQITNTIDGSFYIGSSKDVHFRYQVHQGELRSGKHCNKHLQRAWDRDGEDSFILEILCYCEPGERFEYETRLLAEFVGEPGCYNISKFGGSSRSYPKTERERAEWVAKRKPSASAMFNPSVHNLIKAMIR